MNDTVRFFAGAFLGLLIVRGFFLDGVEELGFRVFLKVFFEGHMDANGLGEIVQTATFMKFVAGFILGGTAGVLSGFFSMKGNVKVVEALPESVVELATQAEAHQAQDSACRPRSQVSYCEHCGTVVIPQSTYCDKCGEKLMG